MRPASLLRYGLSDLWHRRSFTGLNVLAVALSVGYVLVLGFYGASIHRYQRRLVGEALPNKVVATVPGGMATGLRFTEERIAELAALPEVALAFPRFDLNVRASLHGDRIDDVLAEGTTPADPALAPERLAWGRPVSADDAREVVLALRTFEELGGHLGQRPEPDVLVVEVARTVAGAKERERLELAITGLVAYQESEALHVPLALLRRLNLWCRNKVGVLSGDDEGAAALRARYPAASAYAEPSTAHRVDAEADGLRVRAEPSGELEVTRAEVPVRARVTLADGAPLGVADRVRLRGLVDAGELWTSGTATLPSPQGPAAVRVLAPDDPRWAELGDGGPALLATGGRGRAALAAAHLAGEAAAARPDAPDLDADVVCDPAGFRRLAFDPRAADGAERFTLVHTDRLAAAARLARWPGAAPDAGSERGWLFAAADAQAAADAPRIDERGLRRGAWREVELLASDRYGAPPRSLRARLLPAAFLEGELLAHLPALRREAESSCVLAARDPGALPPTLWTATERFDLVRELRVDADRAEVWLAATSDAGAPDWRTTLPAVDEPNAAHGALYWGPWDALLERARALDALDAGALDRARSQLPLPVGVLFDGPADEARERLGASAEACRLHELVGVRVRVRGTGDALVLTSEPALFGAVPEGAVDVRSGSLGARAEVELGGAGWSLPALSVRGARELPPGLAPVAEGVFREAAWRGSTRGGGGREGAGVDELSESAVDELPVPAVDELRLADPARWLTLRAELEDAGFAAEPRTPLAVHRLLRYRVTDPESGDGRVGDDLVAVLRLSQPTFVDARPRAEHVARLEGSTDELRLVASEPDDPERFAELPRAGHWLRTDRGSNQVVLPAAALGPGGVARHRAELGRVVQVELSREMASGVVDRLSIPLEIVGLTDGEAAFAPAELLAKIELWKREKVIYNDTQATFESPARLALAQGDLSCNLFAASDADVAPLVAELRARGYRTDDRLDEQATLRRLGYVLVFLVSFFVLGSVLNAAITVFVATMMNVKSKIYEIGILRAHGLGRAKVIGILASQGLVVGLAAFALGCAVVRLVEPRIRALVREHSALDTDSIFAGTPFDPSLWWLAATALGVAVLFSLVGVLGPAVYACRLSPVEALRGRE